MSKFVASDCVVEALRVLKSLELRRTGRTSVTGFLLLKAKESSPGEWIDIKSQGETSVEPELQRFLRVAPGTSLPDVNPFWIVRRCNRVFLRPGMSGGAPYTQLYQGRNLTAFVEVEEAGRAFRVRIPKNAASCCLRAAGSQKFL